MRVIDISLGYIVPLSWPIDRSVILNIKLLNMYDRVNFHDSKKKLEIYNVAGIRTQVFKYQFTALATEKVELLGIGAESSSTTLRLSQF